MLLGLHLAVEAVALMALWIVLSGKFDLFHLALGVFSVVLVLGASRFLMAASDSHGRTFLDDRLLLRVRWKEALVYPFWLLKEVFWANVGVVKIVLDPAMPVDPVLIRFKTGYETTSAKVTLGQSITLTPGTITLDVVEDEFFVHALDPASAASLVECRMQERVARIFGEDTAKLGREVAAERVFGDVASARRRG